MRAGTLRCAAYMTGVWMVVVSFEGLAGVQYNYPHTKSSLA